MGRLYLSGALLFEHEGAVTIGKEEYFPDGDFHAGKLAILTQIPTITNWH